MPHGEEDGWDFWLVEGDGCTVPGQRGLAKAGTQNTFPCESRAAAGLRGGHPQELFP